MIGYAVKPDGSWRCVDTETMPMLDGEEFQAVEPPATGQGVLNEG